MNGFLILTFFPILLAGGQRAQAPKDYVQGESKWRREMEAALKADEGWLSVAGLYWLTRGVTTLGTSDKADIQLPKGSAPARVGRFDFHDGRVTLIVEVPARVDLKGRAGTPIQNHVMVPDEDRVSIGSVTLMVIKRGDRTGVRLFNRNSNGLKEFKGMRWFPVDPTLRITAEFVPYNPPKTMMITNVLGDTRVADCPGYVQFTLNGKTCRLEAEPAGKGLFFNFKDKTTGNTTYPAGRFLDADGPKAGKVILDFNRAVNPPCAFTAFATCPMPPKGNTLPVAIDAGEKTQHPG
ncbi:MAG: DUF1684 domain-containing protein [Fimbriimonadaceae bacterium]|nr:DUF1684 domain-containing protein [Fimbriimonadaceae bacterium]